MTTSRPPQNHITFTLLTPHNHDHPDQTSNLHSHFSTTDKSHQQQQPQRKRHRHVAVGSILLFSVSMAECTPIKRRRPFAAPPSPMPLGDVCSGSSSEEAPKRVKGLASKAGKAKAKQGQRNRARKGGHVQDSTSSRGPMRPCAFPGVNKVDQQSARLGKKWTAGVADTSRFLGTASRDTSRRAKAATGQMQQSKLSVCRSPQSLGGARKTPTSTGTTTTQSP